MAHVRYFWDEIEDNVIREYDDSNNTIVHYTTEPTLYGSVISQERSGATRYYHFDGQGNTTELTDENGNVTDTRRYSAFGEVTESAGTSEVEYTYGGRWGYQSTLTSQPSLYVRARMYSAQLNRWTTVDIVDGMLETYRYCRNSPTSTNDPSGLQPPGQYAPGKATCKGKPTGDVCGGTRGSFSNITLRGLDDSDWDPNTTAGAQLDAHWTPDPLEFVDANGCCCCSAIGFTQIVTGYAKYTLFGIKMQKYSYDWDGGKLKYGSQPTINPCKAIPGLLNMNDSPNAPLWNPILGKLIEFRYTFTTCVVCLEGNEGPVKTYKHFGGDRPMTDVTLMGVTIYDCFRWGFWVYWSDLYRAYRQFRFLDDQQSFEPSDVLTTPRGFKGGCKSIPGGFTPKDLPGEGGRL